jgi:hypothetical protein
VLSELFLIKEDKDRAKTLRAMAFGSHLSMGLAFEMNRAYSQQSRHCPVRSEVGTF